MKYAFARRYSLGCRSSPADLDEDDSAPLARSLDRLGIDAPREGHEARAFFESDVEPLPLREGQDEIDAKAGPDGCAELAQLTAYIGTFDEVQEICGPRALGCYGRDQLVAPGETVFDTPAEEICSRKNERPVGWCDERCPDPARRHDAGGPDSDAVPEPRRPPSNRRP